MIIMGHIVMNSHSKYQDVRQKHKLSANVLKLFFTRAGHVFSVVQQWPLGWQDSIEYIGFSWVITYFMFNLIKFSAMDESKLHR